MKKRIFAIVMATVMVMAMLPVASLAQWKTTDLPVGIDLTAMKTTDLDGNSVTGELFTNGASYTMMSVWATWAQPAKNSLVYLQEFYRDIEGVNIVGVLFEDAACTVSGAKELCKQLGIEFATLHMDSVLRDLFNNSFPADDPTAVPIHYLIDRNGVVVDARIGSFDDELDVITWITLRQKPSGGDRDVDAKSRGMDVSAMNTTDLNGETVTGEVFAESKLTLINVWATWCGPCSSETKYLEQLHKSDLDVNVMGVLLEDQVSTVEAALNIAPAYRTVRFDDVLNDLFVTSFNGYTAIPVSYLVNSEGTVVAAKLAAFSSYDAVEEWVSTYLAEPAPDNAQAEDEGEFDVAFTNILRGDLNGNLVIEAADATIALRSVIGTVSLNETLSMAADMNGNGRIDSADASLILRLAVD